MQKICWLFLLSIALQSCKLPTNIGELNSPTKLNGSVSFKQEGFNRIKDKKFIAEIQKSCLQSIKCKYYTLLDTDQYFPKNIENNDHTDLILSDEISLSKQYYLGSRNNEGEVNSKSITLKSIKNNKVVDSLKIYFLELGDYYYVERTYYIDKNFDIWILDIYSEEDSLFVHSWHKYTVDSKSGKFKQHHDVNFISENHDSIPSFVDSLLNL
ncbi:hypothetical protein [Psychrobacter sp. DM8]|uniref:hypothetical protein n=1 Tax=Psychrobacter sp. DM8 TaxID=3440636 RepID=UPI003F508D8F